jgi:hypothetical protein
MGQLAANLIIEGKKEHRALPFRLLLRSSLWYIGEKRVMENQGKARGGSKK